MQELLVDFITSLDGGTAPARCARSAASLSAGRSSRRAWSTVSAWVVFPVITGSTGRDRIYDGYPDVALDMVASRTFDGRLQLHVRARCYGGDL
jgi:hypothetical protein